MTKVSVTFIAYETYDARRSHAEAGLVSRDLSGGLRPHVRATRLSHNPFDLVTVQFTGQVEPRGDGPDLAQADRVGNEGHCQASISTRKRPRSASRANSLLASSAATAKSRTAPLSEKFGARPP